MEHAVESAIIIIAALFDQPPLDLDLDVEAWTDCDPCLRSAAFHWSLTHSQLICLLRSFMGKKTQVKQEEGAAGVNGGAGQPQDIAELSDVDIEHVAGQCPGCLQKFGDQDKDGWLSVSMSLEI